MVVLTVGMVQAKTMTYTVTTSKGDSRCIGTCEGFWDETAFYMNYDDGTNVQSFFGWRSHIPKNANITSAYFKPFSAGTYDTTSSTINLDYVTNAVPALAFGATVNGSPVAWNVAEAWTAGVQVSVVPNIASLVTAYIAGASYEYGEQFILRTVGSGMIRYAYGWDYSDHSKAAQLEVTYTGGDGIIDVWMARPESRTKQYVYAQTWNEDAGDKVKFYLDNSLKYTYTITAGDITGLDGNAANRFEKAYLFDYTGLTEGSHHIDVELTTSADAVRATWTSTTWGTTHSGIPTVGINEDNAICFKNGSACDTYFPISMWNFAYNFEPPAWDTFKLFAASNTLVSHGSCDGTSGEFECVGNYYTKSTTWGKKYAGGFWGGSAVATPNDQIPILVTNSSDCDTPESFTDCSYVNLYKGNSTTLGYFLIDEPDGNPSNGPPFFGASISSGWTDQVKAVDTNHPVFLNLFVGTYMDGATNEETGYHYLTGSKMQTADVVGGDLYPYYCQGSTNWGPAVNLETFVQTIDVMNAWNYNIVPSIWFSDPQGQIGALTACSQLCALSGTANAAVTTTDTTLTDTRLAMIQSSRISGTVTCNGKTLTITSNTETTLTGTAGWSGGGNPGNGNSWSATTPCSGWTGTQFANQLWLMVIHGSRGIHHFGPNLFISTSTDIDTAATAFRTAMEGANTLKNAVLAPLSTKFTQKTRSVASDFVGVPIIVSLPWGEPTSVTNSARVDYTVREYAGKTYVIASRVKLTTETPAWPDPTNTNNVTATFTLTGLSGTRTATKKLGTGSVSVVNGVFSDTFLDYGVEVYEIGDATGGGVSIGAGGPAFKINVGAGFTLQ